MPKPMTAAVFLLLVYHYAKQAIHVPSRSSKCRLGYSSGSPHEVAMQISIPRNGLGHL